MKEAIESDFLLRIHPPIYKPFLALAYASEQTSFCKEE